ncbi:MAG TPA: hypothetical protein VFV02_11745 [Acidimicrobiales bacterium]|nr:hypothetical protein [Acidimicrobiales bacterium]
MNISGAFEAEVVRILRKVPGLTVDVEPGGSDSGAHGLLRFAGTRTPIAVEFKLRVNPATAWQLVHRKQDQPDLPLLLVAGETTTQARQILEAHGIALVDDLGNAHIELPGLLLHLEAKRRPGRTGAKASRTRLRGKAGVIAQALLLHPERAWQVKDLAMEAGVSAGLAHRVLARLEQEGVVTAEGSGPNRVRHATSPTALLDLWAEENVEHPTRTRGHLLAQTSRQLIRELGGNLGHSGVDYALTGAGAASLIAPFVTAVPIVEVWVTATATPEDLYEGAGADAVDEGHNVVFLQARDDSPLAFREQANDLWITNRVRLYADLRRDPRRGREQADHLRQELIGF